MKRRKFSEEGRWPRFTPNRPGSGCLGSRDGGWVVVGVGWFGDWVGDLISFFYFLFSWLVV